jgi:hypothetical protein
MITMKIWAVLPLFHVVRTSNMLAVWVTSTECHRSKTVSSLVLKHCGNLHFTIFYSVIILSFGEWAV